MSFLDYIIDYFNEAPFIIKVVWCTSLFLLVSIVFLIIGLQIMRNTMRIKQIQNVRYKTRFESSIIKYLYSGSETQFLTPEQETIISDFKSVLHDKQKRGVVISILYDLMNEVSGEMSHTIKLFYFKTGLYDYAVKRLDSKKWHVIAKSIGELACINISEMSDKISNLVMHPKQEVRKSAQLYLVKLFKFEGLNFLNDYDKPLSEWNQIELLEILQRFENQEICDIKPWLKSKNNSVVLFALKLAQIYNQFEVKDALMELLTHPEKKIRVKTIDVLAHLYGIEAKEMLKANFKNLSLEEQISFFNLLEKLVMPSDEPFVEEHLFHKNFEIQLLAVKILKSINIDKFTGLSESAPKNSNPEIIKFVNTIN